MGVGRALDVVHALASDPALNQKRMFGRSCGVSARPFEQPRGLRHPASGVFEGEGPRSADPAAQRTRSGWL